MQDDDDDVSLGIEQMNSIYQGSYFTIVAASRADECGASWNRFNFKE